MNKAIDTDAFSLALRPRAVDTDARRLLMTDLRGSKQERDLTEPVNCGGFGRIRHFRRRTAAGWPPNPIPIEPALRALVPSGATRAAELRTQVFQNAACNWRCWYCFVDFALLSADPRRGAWLSADELVELYLAEPDRPPVIDLTGGQPDLVPEWVPWMMRALSDQGLDRTVYLWSDDNLSNDYFWRFLTDADRELIAGYRHYGKVGCFKGYSAASFAFNTRADPALFDQQFDLMGRLLQLGIDQYAYVTLTTPSVADITDEMPRFVDRLQELDPNLPLRTVPLEIRPFTPLEEQRHLSADDMQAAMRNQRTAVESWNDELAQRFSPSARSRAITDVPLRSRRSMGV
jgi:uncharacterized Fe-S cluster-containing radical SAM superfamily protein